MNKILMASQVFSEKKQVKLAICILAININSYCAHNLTSTNKAYDFQISKCGSHDFLFQKVSASTVVSTQYTTKKPWSTQYQGQYLKLTYHHPIRFLWAFRA